MDNNKVVALCAHLKQEITWIEALNALLAEEKGLLETRQFTLLEECASKKQDLSQKLEDSSKQRMALISDANKPVEGALTEFLKDCSADEVNQITTLNIQLADTLTICRELNAVNGQVIANNLYVRQEIVNTLSGNKANAVSVYNSQGSLNSSNGNRHHQKA